MKQLRTAGIDVSAQELVVCIRSASETPRLHRFENQPRGHRALVKLLTKNGARARVGLESTGVYSLDLALALQRSPRIVVIVLNPRAVKDFGDALLKRTKTDPEDAAVILEFVERMPFTPWQPPSDNALQLRTLARRLGVLTKMVADEKNRLHASEYLAEAGPTVRHDIEVHLRHLERRIAQLVQAARSVVRQDPELQRKFRRLISIKGIAETSAVHILGELAVLPPDMSARQWAAHAGLDPRSFESGTSIAKPARISRVGNARIRASLYMPALVALRHDPQVRAFYEALVARGKKKMQAVVAIMRKRLHVIHALFRLDVDYDPKKFARLPA